MSEHTSGLRQRGQAKDQAEELRDPTPDDVFAEKVEEDLAGLRLKMIQLQRRSRMVHSQEELAELQADMDKLEAEIQDRSSRLSVIREDNRQTSWLALLTLVIIVMVWLLLGLPHPLQFLGDYSRARRAELGEDLANQGPH